MPYGGPDDPWYAAFGAAGLRRAEEFRRVACAEMFRFKPEGADPSGSAGVSVVASDAFSARLRAEMDAEAEEAGEPPRAERKEKEETKTPELLPSAIPMPASAREKHENASAAAAQFRYFWMLGVRLKNRAWAFLSQGEDEKKSEETETVRHVYS